MPLHAPPCPLHTLSALADTNVPLFAGRNVHRVARPRGDRVVVRVPSLVPPGHARAVPEIVWPPGGADAADSSSSRTSSGEAPNLTEFVRTDRMNRSRRDRTVQAMPQGSCTRTTAERTAGGYGHLLERRWTADDRARQNESRWDDGARGLRALCRRTGASAQGIADRARAWASRRCRGGRRTRRRRRDEGAK